MASIKDFFAAGSTVEMTRITHGTTGQAYTWSCCNLCCYCIPTTTTAWTVEAWGMGGGGSAGCCCEWGCRGGGGANYGASRYESCSCGNAMPMCYCACSCFCGTLSSDGAPGQFSRIHNCQLSNFMCVGGGTGGCSCCNYGGTTNYMNDINTDSDINKPASSSGTGTSGSTTITGFQSTDARGASGENCFGSPYNGFIGGAAGGSEEDALLSVFPPNNSSCSSGWMLCTAGANCTLISRRGACGFSRLNGQCNVSCIRGGGGSSYAGGFQNECCFNPGNWAYCGCSGIMPGGGGVTAGVCGGGCCCGSCGAPGVIMISYDA